MINNIAYENLALDWSPSGRGDNRFVIIAIISLLVGGLIGFTLSSLDVPVEERKARTVIPERIAQLVLEQEKKKPKVVPKPPPKPKPVVKPKPRVKKKPENTKDTKPLTKVQKEAREKAKDTGLLALGSELADLIDTSEINSMVGGKVSQSSGATKTASLDKTVLTKGVGQGTGGINDGQYAEAKIATADLSPQELTRVRQSLLSKEQQEKKVAADKSQANSSGGNVRAEEEITLVFDQNKSKLYSIYNRERRQNPGLKGKIVLEITIAPNGKVTSVKVVSSELNNPKLEKSLISRIKLFKFSSDKTSPITVTYPIEFLPS